MKEQAKDTNVVEDSIIRTTGVTRCFPIAGQEPFYALKGIDITIKRGQLVILKGRSGSGKTTLLNILSALDKPSDGNVFFNEKNSSSLSASECEKLRRYQMGYIFQSVALVPMMTAYENVEFALRLADITENRKERVEKCLHMVGLGERMKHMPYEMSGGEQQRVAIARAIAHNPKVIFADEPTAELDTHTGLQVVKIFKNLVENEKVTIIMTTHDTGLMDVGDMCLEMEDGEIISVR